MHTQRHMHIGTHLTQGNTLCAHTVQKDIHMHTGKLIRHTWPHIRQTDTYKSSRTQVCTQAHIRTRVCTHIHTGRYSHRDAHTRIHMGHIEGNIHGHVRTHTYTQTHADLGKCLNTHTLYSIS